MPPRSKQAKVDWAKCDLCNCSLNSKELSNHREVCSQEKPFSVSSVDLRAVAEQHVGFVWNATLCGLASVVDDEASQHLTAAQADQLLYIHPMTMRLCNLYIGHPVVVNQQCVMTAWPGQNLPLTVVGLSSKALARMSRVAKLPTKKKQKQALLVEGFRLPHIPARDVIVAPRKSGATMDTEEFQQYVKRHLDGKYLLAGSTVDLTYYGRPCPLYITTVTGEDGSCSTVSRSDELSIIDSSQHPHCDSMTELADGLDQLQLEGSSTSQVVDLKLLSQPVFYLVTSRTEFAMESVVDCDLKKKRQIVSLDDIGGLDKEVASIQEIMELFFANPGLFQAAALPVPQAVLLHGPSGCGKTLLAKAIAHHNSVMSVITINTSEIWSKFYGESEAKLASYFKEAKERSPSVLVIDDVDVLCPRRDASHNEVEKRVVASLLSHFSWLHTEEHKVFVIGTSNRLESIDPALRRPGCFDREVEIGVPTAKQRVQILQNLLKKLHHSISSEGVKSIANQAHGFVGADLAALCKEAGVAALRQCQGQAEVVLSEEHLLHGLQSIQPSAMREVALEVPQVKWSDIGGQKDLKHKLKQAIEWPLKHPEAFSRLGIRPPRGLLMYGPPGCSKTMIAKALASESGINFIAIKGPELFSKWVGESERAVRDLFRKARAAAPAIIFFDEIDALAGERGSHGAGGAGDVADRVLAQLLTEIDGVVALQDVTIVAATNRPDRIDKALLRPGRLDRIVHVPLPDCKTRKEIFQIHFRKTPVADEVDTCELVSRTKGYSGAEVAAVCHEAALCAMQEDLKIEKVFNRHFEQALDVVTPRITQDLLKFYEDYQQSSGLHSI